MRCARITAGHLCRNSLVALIGLVACGTVWADPAELETTEVTASVVMARHPHGANITCIALDDGLVFVDTGLSTENAARFRAMMEAQFKRDTKALILTHAHLDHIFGMGAFSDVEVIAAASAKPMFEKQLAMKFDEEKTAVYTNVFPTFGDVIGSAEPFMPTVWVDEEFVLGRPGQQIVFKNTGGHTTGSSYVYFESEGVLVTGDLVQVEPVRAVARGSGVQQAPEKSDRGRNLDRRRTNRFSPALHRARSLHPP